MRPHLFFHFPPYSKIIHPSSSTHPFPLFSFFNLFLYPPGLHIYKSHRPHPFSLFNPMQCAVHRYTFVHESVSLSIVACIKRS